MACSILLSMLSMLFPDTLKQEEKTITTWTNELGNLESILTKKKFLLWVEVV